MRLWAGGFACAVVLATAGICLAGGRRGAVDVSKLAPVSHKAYVGEYAYADVYTFRQSWPILQQQLRSLLKPSDGWHEVDAFIEDSNDLKGATHLGHGFTSSRIVVEWGRNTHDPAVSGNSFVIIRRPRRPMDQIEGAIRRMFGR